MPDFSEVLPRVDPFGKIAVQKIVPQVWQQYSPIRYSPIQNLEFGMSTSFSQPGHETNLADTTRPSSSSSSIAKESSLPSTSSRSLSPSQDIPTPPTTPPVFSSPTEQSSRPPSSIRQCHKDLIFKIHHLQSKEEYIEFVSWKEVSSSQASFKTTHPSSGPTSWRKKV